LLGSRWVLDEALLQREGEVRVSFACRVDFRIRSIGRFGVSLAEFGVYVRARDDLRSSSRIDVPALILLKHAKRRLRMHVELRVEEDLRK
jgi:hypothetical protein